MTISETPSVAGGHIQRGAHWEWKGVVTLAADVVVTPDATLRIHAGTRVIFPKGSAPAPLDRWGLGGRTPLGAPGARHLIVFGAVQIRGTDEAPVSFEGPGMGGIVLAGRSRLDARRAAFAAGAGYAVQCADLSAAALNDCLFSGGRGAVFCCGFGRAAVRRGRCTGSAEPGFRVCDDAVLRADACAFEANDWALAAEGLARVVLRGCRFSGNRRAADVTGGARLRSDRTRWLWNETAVSAQAESRVELSGDLLADNGLAFEALGDAAGDARGARFERNKTAVLLHQRARFRSEDLELRDNGVDRARTNRGGGTLE